MSKHIGYMKYEDGKIAMIEVLGEHNENRKDIFDKNYARYRCSKAKVLKIYDMHNNAFSIHEPSFEYGVGEIIESDNGFDPDLEKVCSSGIRYFLTEEPAKFWNYNPVNGEYKEWHENGRLGLVCTFKDGEPNGTVKRYYVNGQIGIECTYKDGTLDGPYKSYLRNGQIDMDCTFKDGIIVE